MRILVWGFGNYYRRKEQSISKDSIVAFVSGKETGKYENYEIINPKSIFQYNYNKLYIMTDVKAAYEILDELRRLNYKDWDKIVFGYNLKPYTEKELVLFEDGEMKCNSEGTCIYVSSEGVIEVNSEKDWNELRQKKVRIKKRNMMVDLTCEPISRIFGIDRGLPIDRFYIERFLYENSCYIRGTILEVAGQDYTLKYGTNIEKSYIMHVSKSCGDNSIIADLETGRGVVENMVDCFILTQTLPFIFDIKKACENVVKFLKHGGVALVTVPGITQISKYDMDRWGQYWSFTTASLKRLFEGCDNVGQIDVKAYGNMKTAICGLYGLAIEDMEGEELLYQDNEYQQIITAVIRKGSEF